MDLRDRIIFFAVITLIFGSLQFIVYRTLRNYLKEKKLDSKLWKRLSIYPFIIFFIPFIYLFVSRIVVLPKIIYNLYIIPFFIFQVAILFIALYLIIIKIFKLVFTIIKYLILKIKLLKTKYDIIKNKKTVVVFDESRRAFIRSSTLLVTGIAFSGASIGVLKKDDFVIKKHEIKINNLPEQSR